MENKIAIMCPTRGRPKDFLRTYDTWKATTAGCSQLIAILDDNETESTLYEPRLPDVDYIMAPPKNMNSATNYAARLLWDKYTMLGHIGDDNVFLTPGWDEIFLQKYEEMGGTCVLYGDDLFQGEKLPTQAFFSTNIVRAAGFFAIPELLHLYMDNYWMKIGQELGCFRYVPEVKIEHLHYTCGKSIMDENYARVNSPEIINGDRARYFHWEATQKDQLVAQIKATLGMT
jgi:hypothetical protein